MAALTPTVVIKTEFGGNQKVKIFTVTPSSASDTVDLTSHFDTINGVIASIETGADANLLTVHPSVSGLTVTLVTKGADGLAATDWTGAAIRLFVVGTDEGK